ncbi:TM2 domain-containing protein [Oecophyllibacter saccharovorans]|uniref:TM2 domain-containing protein n=1 Tax=Oecophyllibacter saccharovorans TaxID=2558360 RepID=UPI00114263A6|nr:TM2 domain-containing protein [Oecophyllibacter saccharovorans]QDH14941.1 TM2 domain-containing protein [Oecophyllibacter saccharovorans]
MTLIEFIYGFQEVYGGVPPQRQPEFLALYTSTAKNPTVAFALSVFLGSFGIDRFYLDQWLLGFLKLITLGGFGIWTVIDWFLIAGATYEKNLELAQRLAGSLSAPRS